MFVRISKLALVAAAGLFMFAVACGVEASGTPDAEAPADVIATGTSPAASSPTPGRVTPDNRRSTPIATRPTPTWEPGSGSGALATTTPLPHVLLPSPTLEQSHTTPPTPTPGFTGFPPTPSPEPVIIACGSDPVLTHPPMNEGTFTNITPLGNLNPPSHTFPTGHMYFGLASEETGSNDGPFGDGRVFPAQPVFAAADATIASLSVADVISSLSGTTESYQEFGLDLEVCDGILIRYGHIGPLSDRLQTLVDDAEPNWCNSYETGAWQIDRCEFAHGWSVEAGELIAYTSGQAAAFDFGATRPESPGNWVRISECPLDLYNDEQRVQFEQLLGNGREPRTADPLCGTSHQDLPGTAQGRWFLTLNDNPGEDQNIALVHDNFDPDIPVFSIGTSMRRVQSNAYRFVPSATGNINRDFAEVVPGSGVYCYQNLTDRRGNSTDGLTFFLEMPDETTLRIEKVAPGSCGSSPWSLSAKAVTYLR